MISLDTEITEINVATPAQGWVLYDGECRLCTGAADRFGRLLRQHGFELATLQTDWVRERLGLASGAEPAEMVVLDPDGTAFGGADGIIQIARHIWWARPLFALAQIPGLTLLLHAVYRRVAANRHCLGGACRLPEQNRLIDWLPLVLVPTAILFVRDFLPAWGFMWLIAFSLYFGCKWLTWRRAGWQNPRADKWVSVGYLLAWVGMDTGEFMRGRRKTGRPKTNEWVFPAARILIGMTLIWFGVRHVYGAHPLTAGWMGMAGLILCLHFGLFHLLALGWQYFGVDARPVMRRPARAVSLAEFWGQRWNTAFHFLAHDLVFRPLLRRVGPAGATFTVFLLSGAIHELVISLPARGGYGLPTMYFAVQGLGVIFERKPVAKRLGLGRGWRGWLFTMAFAAGSACWLFHPLFVQNVILPMLQAIGAT